MRLIDADVLKYALGSSDEAIYFDALIDENLADADIAVDTGTDVFGPVLGKLVGQLGVGQQLASHRNEVALTCRDGSPTFPCRKAAGNTDPGHDPGRGTHHDRMGDRFGQGRMPEPPSSLDG